MSINRETIIRENEVIDKQFIEMLNNLKQVLPSLKKDQLIGITESLIDAVIKFSRPRW